MRHLQSSDVLPPVNFQSISCAVIFSSGKQIHEGQVCLRKPFHSAVLCRLVKMADGPRDLPLAGQIMEHGDSASEATNKTRRRSSAAVLLLLASEALLAGESTVGGTLAGQAGALSAGRSTRSSQVGGMRWPANVSRVLRNRQADGARTRRKACIRYAHLAGRCDSGCDGKPCLGRFAPGQLIASLVSHRAGQWTQRSDDT